MDEDQTRREVWLLRVLCGHGGTGDQGEGELVEAASGEYQGEVGKEEIRCEGRPNEEKGDLGTG